MPIHTSGDVCGHPGLTTQRSQIGRRLDACLEDADGTLSGHTIRALRADLAGVHGVVRRAGALSAPRESGHGRVVH